MISDYFRLFLFAARKNRSDRMSLSAGENSDFSFIINPNYGILRAVIVRLHKKERKEGNSMALQTYEKEHLHRLRSLLPECTVLLKRDGRFPLDAPC
jgi:hypothetical protein